MRVEWKHAEGFALFAEALGITNDSVMAASSDDGGFFWDVFYTEKPTADPEEWVWHAVIWKGDTAEVLRREKFRTIEQFLAEVRGGAVV